MSLDKLWEFIMEDDLTFYEKYLKDLPNEEFERFMEDNPDFFEDVAKR